MPTKHPINDNLNNAIWALGCSFTYGEGVADNECWASLIQHHTSTPVINLGIPGSSPKRTWLQYTTLITQYTPKLVIFAWPGPHRDYVNNTNLGLWVLDSNHPIQTNNPQLYNEYKAKVESNQIVDENQALMQQAQQQTPNHIHFNVRNILPTFIDLGTDNQHPGPLSHKYIADYIVNSSIWKERSA